MSVCDGTTILEPARPGDVRGCAAIMSDWIDEVAWMPRIHTRAEDRGFLEHLISRGWVTVARRCGSPVGFLARDGSEVHALYIARAVRNQGIGKALLDRIKVDRDEIDLWTFQANLRAQAFYLRECFHEVERTDGSGNDESLPDIRYQWRRG